jgi:hypothetical protein
VELATGVAVDAEALLIPAAATGAPVAVAEELVTPRATGEAAGGAREAVVVGGEEEENVATGAAAEAVVV